MKYIKSIIFAAGLAMLGGCTGDQALPPLNKPEALGTSELGNGQWDTPMSAYQAALGTVPHDDYGYDMTNCWVTGYIVGWVNTEVSYTDLALGADFTAPATIDSNILIASRKDERDPANIATVQLPSGDVRKALNLKDNDNLGLQVSVYGSVGVKYCGQYGVKNVSEFKWGPEGNEPDPAMVLPPGAKEFQSFDFLKGTNGVVFDQGTPSQAGFETWTLSSQYGIMASGYSSGNRYVTDAIAITPVIDLTNYTDIRMSIYQAANYFNNQATFVEMTSTMVREVGGEWQVLEIPYLPAGNNFTYIDSGYIALDEYAGKKVEIGFRYTSTSQTAGTWEIKKLTFAGVKSK